LSSKYTLNKLKALSENIFRKTGIFQNGIFQKESFRKNLSENNLSEGIFQKQLNDPTVSPKNRF
jgi:hypothetical protein